MMRVHQPLQLEKWSVQLVQDVIIIRMIYIYIDQLACSIFFFSSCISKNPIYMIGIEVGRLLFLSSFRSFFICITKNPISFKIESTRILVVYTFQMLNVKFARVPW